MELSAVLDDIEGQIRRGDCSGAAARLTGHILAQEPDNARALCLLARLALMAGDLELARHLCSEALAVDPANPDALAGLANCDVEAGDFESAEVSLRLAVHLAPDRSDLLGNLGAAMLSAGKLESAAGAFEQVLATSPADPVARLNRGILRLLSGDLIGGFADYEARLQLRPRELHASWTEGGVWDGAALPEGVLLVRAEQGLGDTLQFCRLVPLAAERVRRVIFEVQPEVLPVLPAMPNVEVRPLVGGVSGDFDVWCPLLSLAHRLGLVLADIPGVPYLRVPENRRLAWRGRFAGLPGRRIGLVWAGSATHDNDRRRSIPATILQRVLEPLVVQGGVSFVGLQKGQGRPDGILAADIGDELSDFGDTAAVLEQLDLLVTVDTSVAHLAGGLGLPVWVLLPQMPDWRWMIDRPDSPWYPGMRLIRQQSAENWPELLQRLVAELRGSVAVKKV